MRTSLFRLASIPAALCLFSIPAFNQTPQTKPAPPPFAMPPQTTQAQRDNFPDKLLEELARIKSAALTDDYAYKQVAHLTENIGPRPSGSLQAKAAVEYVGCRAPATWIGRPVGRGEGSALGPRCGNRRTGGISRSGRRHDTESSSSRARWKHGDHCRWPHRRCRGRQRLRGTQEAGSRQGRGQDRFLQRDLR